MSQTIKKNVQNFQNKKQQGNNGLCKQIMHATKLAQNITKIEASIVVLNSKIDEILEYVTDLEETKIQRQHF